VDSVAASLTVARLGVPHPAGRSAVSGARWPARYEVRVDGVLDGRWSEWFQGLQIDNLGGETVLSGTLPDQPALHGILDKVRDLGLCIITVRRIPPQEKPGEQRG
jgi:hypothetical protein